MAATDQHQVVCAEVVRRLRQERERRGLSNYAVSKRSGVSQAMLSLTERGLRNPTLETLLKIAAAMEVDLSDIIRSALAASESGPKTRRPPPRPG